MAAMWGRRENLLWTARAALVALALLPASRAALAGLPDWTEAVAGLYVGREWNAGEMACARTLFALQSGALVGHYWVADREPYEGDLTGFVPGEGTSGRFTWIDRFGEGSLLIRFAADGQSFTSLWGTSGARVGDTSEAPVHPGYGVREPGASLAGCGSPGS